MSLIHQKIPSEEVEDSFSKSLANHEGSRRFFPSGSHIYTTSQQVSHPRASSERQKIPPHAHLLLSEFFHHSLWIQQSRLLMHISSRNWTCRHGRQKLEIVKEKETKVNLRQEPHSKKTRGTSYSKKFKAKVQDGHLRDYILLLFVGLVHKSTLVFFFFFFFFLSDSRIVSHLPFSCK